MKATIEKNMNDFDSDQNGAVFSGAVKGAAQPLPRLAVVLLAGGCHCWTWATSVRSRRSRGRSRRGRWWRCHVGWAEGTFCVKRNDWAIAGTTGRALVHSASLSKTWFSPRIRISDHCHDCQTWNLSKTFHCRIFRPEHLHRQFHLTSTALVIKTHKTRCQIWGTIELPRDPISKVLSEW